MYVILDAAERGQEARRLTVTGMTEAKGVFNPAHWSSSAEVISAYGTDVGVGFDGHNREGGNMALRMGRVGEVTATERVAFCPRDQDHEDEVARYDGRVSCHIHGVHV